MTLEEAYNMLNPATDTKELEKILGKDYTFHRFNEAMWQAKEIACECIKRCMEMEDDGK